MGMVACIVGVSFIGCRQGGDISTVEEIQNQDTLIVLCSRLYESRTYEQYLGRWASDSLVLQLVDAGELDEGGWLKALETSNGALLTGGADLDPGLYGQAGDTILCGDIQPIRDSIENRLLNWVNETGVPCLGVCRGLQHMNVYMRAALWIPICLDFTEICTVLDCKEVREIPFIQCELLPFLTASMLKSATKVSRFHTTTRA